MIKVCLRKTFQEVIQCKTGNLKLGACCSVLGTVTVLILDVWPLTGSLHPFPAPFVTKLDGGFISSVMEFIKCFASFKRENEHYKCKVIRLLLYLCNSTHFFQPMKSLTA